MVSHIKANPQIEDEYYNFEIKEEVPGFMTWNCVDDDDGTVTGSPNGAFYSIHEDCSTFDYGNLPA